MPLEANTPPGSPPSSRAIEFFQEVIRIYPQGLRELLELWTIVLADPQTPTADRRRINSLVAVIEIALTEVLETVRARMRVLEEEGHGRGGPARARDGRGE